MEGQEACKKRTGNVGTKKVGEGNGWGNSKGQIVRGGFQVDFQAPARPAKKKRTGTREEQDEFQGFESGRPKRPEKEKF